ncbi:MAG: hypothetical protein AAF676_01400 [Pseudomonadota bacterium]
MTEASPQAEPGSASPTAAPPPGFAAAWVALALGQIVVWSSMFYGFAALLPRWEDAFAEAAGPPPSLGLSLALGVSALLAPAVGRRIDLGQGPRVMPAAAVLGALCLGAVSQSAGPWTFLAAWTVMGAAIAGCLYEPCFALLTRARGPYAKRAIASVTLIAGFATAVAFPSVGALEAAFGWRGAAVGMAAATALLGAPLLAFGAARIEAAAPPDPPRAAPPPRALAPLADPKVARIASAFALGGLCHGMVSAHILALLAARDVAPAQAAWVAASIGPMQVAGRIALLSAPARWRAAGPAVSALGCMAAGALILSLGLGALSAAAFAALFGASIGAITILRPAVLAETAGTEGFGALAGAVALPVMAAYAAAPAVGGALRALGGADLALGVAVALPFVGALVLAPLLRRG